MRNLFCGQIIMTQHRSPPSDPTLHHIARQRHAGRLAKQAEKMAAADAALSGKLGGGRQRALRVDQAVDSFHLPRGETRR